MRVEDSDNPDSTPFIINTDGKVGIGTTNPHASSILDLTSTTQGFLVPRLTTAQRDAIASPANMGSYLCDILGVGAPLVTFGGLTSGSLRTITGTGVTSNKLAPNNTNPSMVTGMIVGSAEIFRSDIGTFLYSVTETLDGAINSPFVTNLSLSITS
jgi:hypothetical protein